MDEVFEAYVRGLRPQRMVVRGVDETRPVQTGRAVTVGPVRWVEVVTVEGGARVVRRFEGVTMAEVAGLARAHGHTVVEATGNIT